MYRYEIREMNNEVLTAFSALPDDAAEIFTTYFAFYDCAIYLVSADGAANDVSDLMIDSDDEELPDDNLIDAQKIPYEDDLTFTGGVASHLDDVEPGTKVCFILKGSGTFVEGKFESVVGKLVKLTDAQWGGGLTTIGEVWLNLDEVVGFRKPD